MADKFNWFRSGYELVEAEFEWNVQLPFLQNKDGVDEYLHSPLFPTPEILNSIFNLRVQDHAEQIIITMLHHNQTAEEDFGDDGEPALLNMSILNQKGTKVLQETVSLSTDFEFEEFYFSKEQIIQSKCQQSDESLTFCWNIVTHVKMEPVSSSADPPVLAVIDCSGGLSSHLEGLFNNMSSSDVILNIRGREFPAHKLILATRSEVFAAMFKHPTKENCNNQVKIEDIEPEVFQEVLRFIYTGRVSRATMETMATGLFIAADKYLLGELKKECENYMLHHMSPDYCLVLLLHGDLQKPTELLKEAAKFFRRLPKQVTATERWEKMKQENPVLLCVIQQFVLCTK
jgi:speckle-type POZ protein